MLGGCGPNIFLSMSRTCPLLGESPKPGKHFKQNVYDELVAVRNLSRACAICKGGEEMTILGLPFCNISGFDLR